MERWGRRPTGKSERTGRYATTFENPVYDRDDDNGNGKHEEAEITANSTGFPQVDSNYYAQVEYSHWYRTCGNCSWLWDPDSAEVGISSQISSFFFGEWQTEWHTDPYRYVSTPFQPAPSGLSTSGSSTTRSTSSVSGLGNNKRTMVGGEVTIDGIEGIVHQEQREVDVRIVPPTQLADYLDSNERRIAALPATAKRLQVVVTFPEPLAEEAVLRLIGARGTIESFEAIGRTRDGQILTVGGPGPMADLGAEFELHDASFSGVVSIESLIETKADLVELMRDEQVLLADVAKEVISRNAPRWLMDLRRGGGLDLILNDVYWLHSGW